MTETERRAARLLRKYDKMRNELRELEHELKIAVLAFAAEEKLGWYDKDKFRLRQQMRQERQTKEKAA
jgi:hypothetical protein